MRIRTPLSAALSLLLLSAGCGSGANSSSQTGTQTGTGAGNTLPAASLSPSSLTFAATPAGSPSAALPLTLSNTGGAALIVTGVALSGTNPGNFSQTSNCATVAAGASCTISVIFTPTAASATYTANLTVTDNTGGAAGSTQTVAVSGTGAAPAPVPQAVLAPTALSFSAPLLSASAAQTVTLSNPGTATLTGIATTLSGSSAFTQSSNTCGTTLAAGASCAIAIIFTPVAAGTVTGTLSVAGNASGSPQTVTLTGAGAVPVATFSASSIAFPATRPGSTSAASSVTLTNTGAATLTISSIALGGANPSSFTETNTCGLTLAAAASCSISATFSPAAATSYTAAIAVTDSAAGSPHSIALSGSGSSSSANTSYQLLAFPEADNSVTPLYALVNAAQKTIDMTMYALEDTTFSADLVAACKRGVTVRVILDQNDEKSGNTPAYNQLNAQANCSAVWANKAFEATHQKSFILDGTQVAIMSLNLQSQYYSTTRDFALIENDAADIAAIQATFNADYAAGTPSSGVAGASDFSSYTPGLGDNNDLIWSPTTAQAAMLGIIDNATSTLLVENEEMGAANIVSAFEAACQRGVKVKIAMVNQSSYTSNFTALKAAGCSVSLYPNTQTGFYIHAKAVVADFGLSTQSVYMGSINYSLASMNDNRELGVFITDPTSVTFLNTTMAADFAGATPF